MNITNSSYAISIEMWILYSIFYITIGLLSLFVNIILVVTIILNKKLHTFFFVLLTGHSIGQILCSVQYILAACYRITAAYFPNIIKISRLKCHFLNFMFIYGTSFWPLTAFLLGFDRLIALLTPMWYHSKRFNKFDGIFITFSAAFFILVAKFIPSYFGSPPLSHLVICTTTANAVTSEWMLFHIYVNVVLAIVILVMDTTLLIVANIQTKSLMKNTNTNSSGRGENQILKRQLKQFNSIRLIFVLDILMLVPLYFMYLISNYVGANTGKIFLVRGASVSLLDQLLKPIILFCQSSELKSALVTLSAKLMKRT